MPDAIFTVTNESRVLRVAAKPSSHDKTETKSLTESDQRPTETLYQKLLYAQMLSQFKRKVKLSGRTFEQLIYKHRPMFNIVKKSSQ